MGKPRGKRRTVLQLSDNKDSFLARYGYGRQNEEDEDSRGAFADGGYEDDEQGSDEEHDEGAPVKDGASESSLPGELNGGKTDIDDKVADFLAEIDALPVPDDEEEDEEEEEDRPSCMVEIPPPSFKLNVNQQSSNDQEPPAKTYSKREESAKEMESRSKYKSMFVKGASECMRQNESTEAMAKESKAEQWPEEPVSVWQQTLDDHTQCFYYWNTVTNEVTWEITAEFTQYLLLRKEYDEKVDRLTKEGRVKPTKPKQDHPDSRTSGTPRLFGPELPSGIGSSLEGVDNSGVSSTSSFLNQKKSSGILKNTDRQHSPKPDSTKPSKALLVDATYFNSDDDSDNSSSEYESDDPKTSTKKNKDDSDSAEVEMDLDDIDAALDMAFDSKEVKKSDTKKTSKEDPKADVKEKKKEAKGVKQKSLVDEMKEQVQKRQEMEARIAARRKAAIEEMMARELERRVGPPRKRSCEEDLPQTVWDSKRPKSSDFRKREHEHGSHRSSSERDHDRDSKRKHDDRKDKKKKKDDRHSRDRDEKGDKRKDRDKDKDKDEKKKDKHRDRDEKKKEKDGKKEKEKKESKKEEKKEKKDETEVKVEKVKEVLKVEEEIVKKVPVVEELPPETEKFLEKAMVKSEDRLKEVQLANLKMQASELADLALSKLEFLEVTKKGLSKLQILLIELETRHQDWQAGGLNTEFFVAKLEEANWQLQQYEQSAAPPGWTCHWDRAYRRYFYMSKRTKHTQWDYPDDEDDEDDNDDIHNANAEKESSDKFVPRPPDGHPGQEGELPQSPESHSITSASPEPTNLSSSMRDIDMVTSTTVVSGGTRSEVGSIADTTVSSKSAVISSSHLRPTEASRSKETVQESRSSHIEEGPQPRGLNYLSGNEMSIFRGEPPPPGTDLEMLLTAPPPPPPPDDQRQGYGSLSEDEEEERDQGRHEVQNGDSDMDVDSNEALPSTVQTYSPQSDGAITFSQSNRLGDQTYATNMDHVSNIITRGPQIFSSDPVVPPSQGMGDGYYTGAMADMVDSSGSFAAASSTQDFVEGAGEVLSTSHPSSPYPHDKEKKKKKKDKTMSSTSLTLKKKNVSSMVLKWQKVKKEVEIEERNREERENAIRQQLEELKQEYS
ncbi:formin-binding protein 4-like [Mizuhopecten yessoensis]|uniref:Formin-binding protein 4 n=1 Tax=Mizuhopecten yessoensis TaxID=6573 RepID=A0A210PSZ9_MIZYE|nr:formin-binding protein 4-like [Mizuhopecten yessoensis]OWF39592.1 Formin-binding protein 4 [Mizuhopecten yessoensis]